MLNILGFGHLVIAQSFVHCLVVISPLPLLCVAFNFAVECDSRGFRLQSGLDFLKLTVARYSNCAHRTFNCRGDVLTVGNRLVPVLRARPLGQFFFVCLCNRCGF
jgi:hypothetical protein